MHSPENPNENTCSLAIAGLGVRLHCDHPTLVNALQSRYQDFPLDSHPRLLLEIILSGQERTSAMLDTGMSLRENGVYFSAPGYTGQILPEAGAGKLLLSSVYPEEDIDYFIRVAYALLAFQAGGVMLHAAGIVRDDLAYLFFGHSGAGKTTVSRLSSHSTVLNDDLVIILPEKQGWRVFGSPFWNHSQVKPAASNAPLTALYSLVQDHRVKLEPLRSSEALAELAANTPIIAADAWQIGALLERLTQIIQTTPVKRLHFQPDASFWNLILPQPE